MEMMQLRPWTPRHDNPIAGQRKRHSHPSCVSPSQHINLITSLHLRQWWGIWGHNPAFGMPGSWWDFHVCRLKSMLLHSWWGSLSTQRNVTQRKRLRLRVNRKTNTISCLDERSLLLLQYSDHWNKEKKKTQFRCKMKISAERACMNGSCDGECFISAIL